MEFDKQRAIQILIKPFKEQGLEFISTYSYFAYQKNLLDPLKHKETPERLALLTFMAVLFDSQKASKVHYKEVLDLYRQNPDFFTLEHVLALSAKEAARFARKDMRSMAKKGDYMQTSYRHLADKYNGSMLNVLHEDITITLQRLMQFKGISDGLSGLYVHTVRDHNIFTFANEKDFCPKVDFHDYNIGRALGIINQANPKKSSAEKKAFSHFLRDLAQEEEINIFDLDAYLWATSQFCVAKNDELCKMYCPLAKNYTFPRAYSLRNDYSARSTKAKLLNQITDAKKLQGTLELEF